MKPITELKFGFRDAENYRRKENKDLFNHLFVRTESLDRLCESGTYFLVGEKGTGKTAYSVYMCNNHYRDNISSLRYIRETEYQKFVQMKSCKHLVLSDYADIWKVIVLLLLAQQIIERESDSLNPFKRFTALRKAIDEFYAYAFTPEIIQAIRFADEAKISAELLSKHAKLAGEEKETIEFNETRYQTNLSYIQKKFEEAFAELRLSSNYLLFIDGIDIRPPRIQYDDYLDCIKGLANAIWNINNDFFANIKGKRGRYRVVLLIRPDILDSLNLQNTNSKINDNSVVLDWRTTYADHRRSHLFSMADKLLGLQQTVSLQEGQAWDHYFPFDSPDVHSPFSNPSSFISALRWSLYRPRDILTILSTLKENFTEEGRGQSDIFKVTDFLSPSFSRKYSDYLLGEVKDHLAFYYEPKDYELLLKFFQFLNGRFRFSYEDYMKAFSDYDKYIKNSGQLRPVFCESPDKFLQFLYELNVLGYVVETEDKEHPLFGWCFLERTPSNISPKVRSNVRYDIHYGLRKALDLGKKMKIDGLGISG